MAFEQHIPYELDQQPLSTLYKFAEVEMNQLLNLTPGRNYWESVIHDNTFDTFNPDQRVRFSQATKRRGFWRPEKDVLIDYHRLHRVGYKTISKLHGISSRTIAKRRFENRIYYPIFQEWNEEYLARWNNFKHVFNLWQQDMIQNQGYKIK